MPIGLRVHKVRTLVLLDKSPAFITESVPKNALFWGFFAIFSLIPKTPLPHMADKLKVKSWMYYITSTK